ncbi:MAG TPA: CBS domain-containing protein [Gemmatimonadales bacterium]|nr:CBS domain-containing protein [Gemmatimonadales bacterium]
MKVAAMMRADVRTIPANATVADAAAMLVETGLSALPVIDPVRGPVGVATCHDILRAAFGAGSGRRRVRSRERAPVTDAMSPWPPSVAPDADVDEAARLMLYLDVKRVFVVENGSLVGVVSQTDITDAVATAKL